jgi:3-hydroxy-9,10-secoandrosta-1,3,5(10)-triene-9,17-dione monooxygenase reductase component
MVQLRGPAVKQSAAAGGNSSATAPLRQIAAAPSAVAADASAADASAADAAAAGVAAPHCEAEEFRRLMSHWPTGVTVVTARDADSPAGCTVSAVMCVSLAPPLLAVSLAASSKTLDVIRRTGAFGLNVLGSHQRELCQRFSKNSQRDRFRGLSYRYQDRMPLLSGVVAAIVCAVCDSVAFGDHVLVVGTPVWQTARHDGSPLVRHRHGYRSLAEAPAERTNNALDTGNAGYTSGRRSACPA